MKNKKRLSILIFLGIIGITDLGCSSNLSQNTNLGKQLKSSSNKSVLSFTINKNSVSLDELISIRSENLISKKIKKLIITDENGKEGLANILKVNNEKIDFLIPESFFSEKNHSVKLFINENNSENFVEEIKLNKVNQEELNKLSFIQNNNIAQGTITGVVKKANSLKEIELDVEDSKQNQIHEIILNGDGFIGSLTDKIKLSSKVLENIKVVLFDKDNNKIDETKTSEDGSFSINAPLGKGYYLSVEDNNYISFKFYEFELSKNQISYTGENIYLSSNLSGTGKIDNLVDESFFKIYNNLDQLIMTGKSKNSFIPVPVNNNISIFVSSENKPAKKYEGIRINKNENINLGNLINNNKIKSIDNTLIQTNRNLDLAIKNAFYFDSVKRFSFFTTATKSGDINYTEYGHFNFDENGYLKAHNGNFALGLFDRTKSLIPVSNLKDISGNPFAIGIESNFTTEGITLFGTNANEGSSDSIPFNIIFNNGDSSPKSLTGKNTIFNLLSNENEINSDRIIGDQYVPSGQLFAETINENGLNKVESGITIGKIKNIPIIFNLSKDLNKITNTSYDNANYIAKAINKLSKKTFVSASVVRNKNNLNQATLVLGISDVILSEAVDYLPNNPTFGDPNGLRNILTENKTGLVKTFKDIKGNLFYAVNSLTLFGNEPDYKPELSDNFIFYGTGTLINISRGKNSGSAPLFNTGIHIAISNFKTVKNLTNIGNEMYSYNGKGFIGKIGFAGLSRRSQINTKFGIETNGSSTIGVENVILANHLVSKKQLRSFK